MYLRVGKTFKPNRNLSLVQNKTIPFIYHFSKNLSESFEILHMYILGYLLKKEVLKKFCLIFKFGLCDVG
jgi:hypothetical protein